MASDTYFPRTIDDIEDTTGDVFCNTVHSDGSCDIWHNIPTSGYKDTSWIIYQGSSKDIGWHIFPETIASIQNFLLANIDFSHVVPLLTFAYTLREVLVSNFPIKSVQDDSLYMSRSDIIDSFSVKDTIQDSFTLREQIVDTFEITRVINETL